MKKMIYADNAATTELDKAALEAMMPFLSFEYGNCSQPYAFARKPKQAIKQAREVIARCINAEPEEIIFTSCASESNSHVIKSIIWNGGNRRSVITSEIEHHAVLNSCEAIKKIGYSVTYLPVSSKGVVLEESLKKIITKDTYLVSIMLANNEIGTIEPIKELAYIAHSNGALFHTDAVQAVGHIPVDVKELDVDFLSASAHKFNGPKGIGFLYVKKGTALYSLISGGSQEFGFRAGTENVASIVGMAVALKNNCDKMNENRMKLVELENEVISSLKAADIDFIRNGAENHIPGNINLSFRDWEGETLLHRLDLMGISVSTGSACDSVNTQLSHVIRAIEPPKEYANGTIRISLGKNNTQEDIQDISKALIKIIKD